MHYSAAVAKYRAVKIEWHSYSYSYSQWAS